MCINTAPEFLCRVPPPNLTLKLCQFLGRSREKQISRIELFIDLTVV